MLTDSILRFWRYTMASCTLTECSHDRRVQFRCPTLHSLRITPTATVSLPPWFGVGSAG